VEDTHFRTFRLFKTITLPLGAAGLDDEVLALPPILMLIVWPSFKLKSFLGCFSHSSSRLAASFSALMCLLLTA